MTNIKYGIIAGLHNLRLVLSLPIFSKLYPRKPYIVFFATFATKMQQIKAFRAKQLFLAFLQQKCTLLSPQSFGAKKNPQKLKKSSLAANPDQQHTTTISFLIVMTNTIKTE